MAEKQCSFPISRIKTIMKSSPEVSAISQESLLLVAKATELFVQHLACKTLKEGGVPNRLEYSNLAELVDTEDTLQFLVDIIPKKIKVKDYWALTGKRKVSEEES